jgi:signal transduction histidine kinase
VASVRLRQKIGLLGETDIVKFQQNLRAIRRLILTGLSPRSVAGSIILPIVLVTIIAGSVAIVVSSNYMASSAAKSAEIRLDGVATQAAEQIGALQARSLGDTSMLSQDPVITSPDTTPAEKLAEMTRIQMFYGTFESVTLVDTNGKTINSTDNKNNGEWGNNSLFQSAILGIPSMSDTTILSTPNTLAIQIASPVLDSNAKVASVLIAQMSMDNIWQIINRVRVGATGYVCLIDGSGNIIAGPDKAKLFQKIVFFGEGSQMPPEHQMIQYSEDGTKMCAVVAGINPLVPWAGSKWSFVGIMPASEAFAPANEVAVIFWIVMGILILLFVVVGLVLGRTLSDKIKNLAKGTAEIASGNLSYRLPTMQPKDLGQLADSFNSMAARLEISSAEIAKWNAHLAEQIEAKTKELEKLMAGKVQSERLSAMGYIAASVAHELNDPLTAISGYAQLGIKESEKSHSPQEMPNILKNASDYFRNIEKELQRSKNILRKLISFVRYSKTGDGAVNVNQVMGDTLSIVRHHLEMNKVELLTQLQPELPPVRGDTQQLQQVFLNMLLNAQKAMPNGGKLNIKTRQHDGNGRKVEVFFSDTGGGILPENLNKIFEPLPSREAEGESTRLDLSITYDIVKQLGGEIKVKSEVGVGTTFLISLLAADGSSLENKANSRPAPPKGG